MRDGRDLLLVGFALLVGETVDVGSVYGTDMIAYACCCFAWIAHDLLQKLCPDAFGFFLQN